MLFFFNDASSSRSFTLSLHDALPISSTMPSLRNMLLLRSKAGRSARRPEYAASRPRVQALSRAVSERARAARSEEHTSELQSHVNLVCRLLLEKKNHKEEVHYQSNYE